MNGLRARGADDGILVDPGDHDHDDGHSAMARTLAACAQLAGASAAAVLSIESPLSLTAVAHAGSAAIDLESPAMRTAAELEAALMFPAAAPNWVPADDGQPGATTLVRVASAGAVTYILALVFETASAVARARVARLIPTLTALIAAQIEAEGRFEALEERHSACVLALDHGTCGVIAVRADHTVLFSNTAAAAMLADGDGLHLRRGVVRPVDYRQAVRFEAALDAVQEGRGAGRAGKPPALVMLLPSQGKARPLIVAVVPARAGPASAQGASALIYLFQPDIHSVHGLDTIAELHGLSGVERRLLAQLCAGLTVAESAERLRIKLETARAYLKQIFAKTGTHRQAELVALMTRYLRVMRGDFDFRPA
ncbi:helix-turn-helix transcriptional regulator [uncultured Sphingomonas sp.]|uniref:helix-turn-helix transcriptional regulator n=1 Tax=uncultured Sphingomonas sp. TaxID=158754 RepID=UPI0035CB5984